MCNSSSIKLTNWLFLVLLLQVFFTSCQFSSGDKAGKKGTGANADMKTVLEEVKKKQYTYKNGFCAEARLAYCDSMIALAKDPQVLVDLQMKKAGVLLEFGDEATSVALFEKLLPQVEANPEARKLLLMEMGMAYLRLAERNNCVNMHPAGSCIMPIQGPGIHQDKSGAQNAFNTFLRLLEKDDPGNLDARWLLNIAAMTMGEYPGKIPAKWLIPGLDKQGTYPLKPFTDAATSLGIATNDRSGGSIVDDFDNDGYLDIVTSAWGLDDPMHYMHNNGDGTFADFSQKSGLGKIMGGLNINQTDYNNDGNLDIFVMRGGWQGMASVAEQPNSLLRNNGDGTFTDVTIEAGMLSFHPTQTATWNDFNNDGWLDVFIGNESTQPETPHLCELYINNKNGTFTNVATPDKMKINAFVKGVTSGDYDNDGWIDLFISTMDGTKLLLRNRGVAGKVPVFENATPNAGLKDEVYRSFPTWFFDYDNDGWLDIFVCNYEFDAPLSHYAAKEALHPSNDKAGKPFIYHNNTDGTFTNVTAQLNLNQTAFAMGSNFGDIDNDGYLDFFLGTGNPSYKSLVPNKLFKNIGGKKFADATASARVGSLQKGHAVSIADIDNDGDQDIHMDMGGAYKGDSYFNSLFLNPGQNTNNWITIQLEGTKSNRVAIGAKVTVYFTENGQKRQVYREVNAGGSFGCSSLRREIGVGNASVIEEIVVNWPASHTEQHFNNVAVNQFIKIKEGQNEFTRNNLKVLPMHVTNSVPMCKPAI